MANVMADMIATGKTDPINLKKGVAVAQTFMSLMGENVTPHKKFIEENSWRANIDV